MALVYITRRIPALAETMLGAAGHEVVVNAKDRVLSKHELIRELRKRPYDAVLCLLTDTIDKDVFDAAPRARVFSNYAVGFNNIDIEEAKRRGVIVSNTPGAVDETVAEHTVALIMALATRTVEGDAFLRAGRFKAWDPLLLLGTDLKGKTVGILGAGRIGERVARALHRGFDMDVMYFDIRRNGHIEQEYGARYVATPEEVLTEADVISLHVPLNEQTRHFINAARLALMKKKAYLVNTSRGAVVDEEALAHALSIGLIAGAALDVYEHEPKVHRKLLKLRNVILTPHIASATGETRDTMAELAAESIIEALKGAKPRFAVA